MQRIDFLRPLYYLDVSPVLLCCTRPLLILTPGFFALYFSGNCLGALKVCWQHPLKVPGTPPDMMNWIELKSSLTMLSLLRHSKRITENVRERKREVVRSTGCHCCCHCPNLQLLCALLRKHHLPRLRYVCLTWSVSVVSLDPSDNIALVQLEGTFRMRWGCRCRIGSCRWCVPSWEGESDTR